MILLDTHIWIWWVHHSPKLPQSYMDTIRQHENSGLGISIISCWEVAKLAEYNRLELPCSALDWINTALDYPGVNVLPLSPEIIVDSTNLPGTFHKDPADQLITATARIHELPLLTLDNKILSYEHVRLANN